MEEIILVGRKQRRQQTTPAMFVASSLHLPTSLKPHPSPFLHGTSPTPAISLPSPLSPRPLPTALPLTIHAMRKLQGRVVRDTNDKTVAVEVVRLAPHPKYKRRIKIKKKYQAHDPLNQFKVGDFVQLEESRPISKTKTFVAVAVASRSRVREQAAASGSSELGIPLQSNPEA